MELACPRSRRGPPGGPRRRGSCGPRCRCTPSASRSRGRPGSSAGAPGRSRPRGSSSGGSPPSAIRPIASTSASIAARRTSWRYRLLLPTSRVRKVRVAHTVAGVELAVGLEHRHAPLAHPELDRPVQRRRSPIAPRAGVHDQAAMAGPDRLGDQLLQHRAHDQLRAVLADGRLHRGGRVDHRDRHVVAELGQRDPGALTEAVVRRHQEEDPQRPRVSAIPVTRPASHAPKIAALPPAVATPTPGRVARASAGGRTSGAARRACRRGPWPRARSPGRRDRPVRATPSWRPRNVPSSTTTSSIVCRARTSRRASGKSASQRRWKSTHAALPFSCTPPGAQQMTSSASTSASPSRSWALNVSVALSTASRSAAAAGRGAAACEGGELSELVIGWAARMGTP